MHMPTLNFALLYGIQILPFNESLSASPSSIGGSLSSPPLKFKSTPCNRICRYNAQVYDGKVCIGCYRDEHEISSWSGLSSIEKTYVLEDAADRADELDKKNMRLDGAISSDELRRQASMWINYDGLDDHGKNTSESISESTKTNAEISCNKQMPVPSQQDELTTSKPETTLLPQHHQQPSDIYNGHLPPTPCTRICRYNSNCYDGNVCIGCFRDVHDIEHWSGLSTDEKMYALEDAADRCHEIKSRGFVLEGSLEEPELRRQASMWGDVGIGRKMPHQEVKSSEEVDIKTNESFQTLDGNYAQFIRGESVIIMPSIIPLKECQDIVMGARLIADRHHTRRCEQGLTNNGLVRIPTIAAKMRAEENGTPCAACLDHETDKLLEIITQRVYRTLDRDYPALVESIFGKDCLLEDMYMNGNLAFSSREPAVNVYTPGGEFLPHEDGQKLTILIPLSDAKSFDGGGTGFWHPDSSSHRVTPPSLVLRPTPGSVILFVGHVTHAGLPLITGERVAFVMSFSRKL